MVFLSLLPIIMILVLLIGFTKIPTYVGGKVMKWLIAVYVVILLGSVVTYSLIPDTTADFERVEEMYPIENMSVYEALFKRQLDKLEPYIQEQWSFDYHSGHEFIIRSDNENMVDNIYIYEKEKEDGVIDVTFYSTDFNLNGNIIDDDRFTPSIELIENELVIIRSAEIEFTIAGEEQELIISQFSEHPRNLMSGGFGTSYNYQNAIVIEVPLNTEISADSNFHMMVDEE